MRYIAAFFFLLSAHASFAQPGYWNNWIFGSGLGMNFDNNTRNILKDPPFYSNYGAACISDSVTGELLFTTDGKKCFDKNFDPMSGDFGISLSVYSFIVPDPASASRYYVFATDNAHTIYYMMVDMSLRNGAGDVTGPPQQLRTNADHHFTAVKRLYGDGYWLITHTYGSDAFEVFAITADGIDPDPIKSKAGKTTSGTASFVYGNMISNKEGGEIVHCASNFAQVFDFDKQCGTLLLKHDLHSFGSSTSGNNPFAAYSLSDRYLYIVWNRTFHQYDMNENDPNDNKNYLGTAIRNGHVRIALGPDGLIYCTESENSSVTPRVSVIHDADEASAYFSVHDVDLNPSVAPGQGVENWPPFIMDWSDPDQPGFEKPQISIAGGCINEDVLFEASGNFQFDSLYWEMGNGDTVRLKNFNYKYQTSGEFNISFNWYLCGIKYSLKQTKTIGNKPEFNLGNDTTICTGEEIILTGPAGADFYLWSDGSSETEIKTSEPGIYWLTAGNGDCLQSDTIKVEGHPPVLVELGQDHFICETQEDFERLDAGKGFEAYKWTPTGDTTQWIIVRKAGDYYVIVRDFRGCTGEDGTTVERRCPVLLQMPNAFSPNGDELNEEFRPVFSDVVTYRLVIYNRWGEEIFRSTDPENGWTGEYKNGNTESGVYIYTLNYSGYGADNLLQSFSKSGSVHLMR